MNAASFKTDQNKISNIVHVVDFIGKFECEMLLGEHAEVNDFLKHWSFC